MKTILLVDDSPELLEIYAELLKNLPSEPEIHTANSGTRALAMLEGEEYRLLICDLKMPKVDGLELLRRIKYYLAGGLPAMFGFTVYSSIDQADASGKIPFPSKNERIEGGHAILEAALVIMVTLGLGPILGLPAVFIAISLAGGLITNARAAFAFLRQFRNVVPIWGIQHMHELEQFITLHARPPHLDSTLQAAIDRDRRELAGSFCRGCAYCLPCPAEIPIQSCTTRTPGTGAFWASSNAR